MVSEQTARFEVQVLDGDGDYVICNRFPPGSCGNDAVSTEVRRYSGTA